MRTPLLLVYLLISIGVTLAYPFVRRQDWLRRFLPLENSAASLSAAYRSDRDRLLAVESFVRTGGTLQLSAKEQAVSDFMTSEKVKVIESARLHDTVFPPAISFFQAKKYIDESVIFKIIQEMPKGGALHVHDSALVSLDWVIKQVTYRPNLYRCFDGTGDLVMHFFSASTQNGDCQWELLSSARARYGNNEAFDQELYRNMSIIVDDPAKAYPTTNAAWVKFNNYFKVMAIQQYEPVMRDYVQRALEEFDADNVQYMEIRVAALPHNLNGERRSLDYTVLMLRQIISEYKNSHPSFIGAKIIFSGLRFDTQQTIQEYVKACMEVRDKYPDVMLGFDLVAQEDLGQRQHDYLDQLLYPTLQGQNLPFYFHAGETRLQGSTDLNLIDAVLLNTSRIGHGFALLKHPEALRLSRERRIAVEVQPISNQVLNLVSDLRNHPAAVLLANNHPMVISSDDPPVWNAKPLSHDFYVTFMALTSETDDLRVLKQLAINSFEYSGLTQSEKYFAFEKWLASWDSFIDRAYSTYVPNAA